MRRLLGLTPPDDRRGCLQDIHWYDGAWGYFPTYTLGAMAAAQIFAAAIEAAPQIPDEITRGEFTTLLGWLRTQSARQGLARLDARAADRSDRPAAGNRRLSSAPPPPLPRRLSLSALPLAAYRHSALIAAQPSRYHEFSALNYISTRGEAPILAFDDVVLAGLARDGGLICPGDLATNYGGSVAHPPPAVLP